MIIYDDHLQINLVPSRNNSYYSKYTNKYDCSTIIKNYNIIL